MAAAFLAVVVTLTVVPANAAQAHHGFDDFDTDRPYYLAGTVSQVRWGDPHSYFSLTLESDLDRPAPAPARTAAVISLTAWTGVTVAGSLLSYT